MIDDPERCLLQRVRDGDAAAFGELVTHHSSSALRVANVVLGTTEGASDAVQSATLRAWRARARIDPGRGFRAWYLRIVTNTARNDRRSRSRRAALAVRAATIPPADVVTPEAAAVTATEREIVLRGLNHRSADDRLVLALRFFEDMTQADIAAVLGCPAGTAKSRLSRATARLRETLSSKLGQDVMNDDFTTERLEAVLTSIGHHLEVPEGPIEPVTGGPMGSGRRAGHLLRAAAAAAVIAGGVVLVPPARAAIADLLGVGSTRIEITGEEPDDDIELPHVAVGLDRISVEEAAAILGRDLPDTSGTPLGPPDAVYAMPEGGVLLAWRDDTATLWLRAVTDTDTEIMVRKLLVSGESAEPVDDLETDALVITDAHLFETPRRRLAAGRVLLWYDDRAGTGWRPTCPQPT